MRLKLIALFLIPLMPLWVSAQRDTIPEVDKLLNLSLEELMNLTVVTASGFQQTVSEAPSTITVITSKQIEERGYEQLEDALRDVPGIDMIHINGYAPTLFYFRGMYGAENLRALMMIDGIAENNILGSNDLAGPAYNLHNIDRIEIIWGPVSALYGANAFGGVINMITKKGAELNQVHIEQGFGSYNTSLENVNLGIRKGKWEFAAAGTLYSTDGPKFNNRDPNYTGSYVDKAHSFNGVLSFLAKKSTTSMGYRTYRTPMGWGTYSNSPTVYFNLPPQGNNNSGVLGIVQRNFRGERPGLDDAFLNTWFLQNEYKPSDKWQLTGRVVYRETGTADDSYIYVTLEGRRMIRALIATRSTRIAGEFSANYSPSDKHHFSAGVEYFRDNVERGARRATYDPNTIYLVDGRDTVVNLNSTYLPRLYDIRRNFGGYLQYNLLTKFLHKTNFTGGIRFDHNNYFGDALSPRLAIVNQPGDKWTIKLQYGNAFRAPTNLEISQTPAGSGFRLKKEKIRTFELNLIYAPNRVWTLQLNGFRNELTDVIILGNLSGFTADKNPGVFTINGIEAIANATISQKVSGYANLTYQHTFGKNLITGASGPLPGMAKWKANAGAVFSLGDLLRLNISANWVGDRRPQRTNPFGTIDGYVLLNGVLSTRELFNKRVVASLNVRNILNKKWLDPGFRTADGFLYSTVLEQPGTNGMFKIGITL